MLPITVLKKNRAVVKNVGVIITAKNYVNLITF